MRAAVLAAIATLLWAAPAAAGSHRLAAGLRGGTGTCTQDDRTLCLLEGRFAVEVAWRNQHAGGVTGVGHAVPATDRSGFFWFFREDNVELVVKALDGRPINGAFWFFYGALSDVEYDIIVTDTTTGEDRTYHNEPGNLCGAGDTVAFPVGAGESEGLLLPPDSGPASLATTAADATTRGAAPGPGRGRWRVEALAADGAETGPATALAAAGAAATRADRGRNAGSRVRAASSCEAGPQTLCLLNGRLAVRVDWRNQRAGGATGTGGALPGTDRSGYFWFFREDNVELVVKALDGRPNNERLWFFYGALSDVEYAITVTDTLTGTERTYVNPPGNLCGSADLGAFCDDPGDCRPPIHLASTSLQGRLEDPLLLTLQDFDLAGEVDVVSLHQDFYGVPWEELGDGRPLPGAWVERMEDLRARTDAWGRPVYLSLALVQGDSRAFLADRAVETAGGELALESEWSGRCFNFDTHPDGERLRRAYVEYVRTMVEWFDPEYLTTAIEINLFQESCDATDPGAYDALMTVANEAYAAAKEVKPWLPVFPSIQIDFLHDIGEGGECFGTDPGPCIEAGLARNAPLLRDRFAVSLYPHLVEPAGIEIDYAAYFDEVLERLDGERPVVAETGYNSTPLVLNFGTSQDPVCLPVFPYSADRQRAYFDAVVAAARRWRMELVTWWSNRDVFPPQAAATCPCQDPEGFCFVVDIFRSLFPEPWQGELLFKAFATMGVRDWTGAPKPLLERWQEVRAEE